MNKVTYHPFNVLVMALIGGAVMLAVLGCPPPPGGGGSQVDADGDGVNNDADNCADTVAGAQVDENGCAASQRDTDEDGVNDDVDQCANTPSGVAVDATGCENDDEPRPLDLDSDGVLNDDDDCPNTAPNATVDVNGCSSSQRDSDDDGVTDNLDQCENTRPGATVDAAGCPVSQPGAEDIDDDGVGDDIDNCPGTPANATVDPNGCALSQLDSDNDDVTDDADDCPNTTAGATVDADGCAAEQRDDDADGVPNGRDACPGTPAGTSVGNNGCPSTGTTTPVCGNGAVEEGEQCDPPTANICSAACQIIPQQTVINTDTCASAIATSGEGTFEFNNETATTDGPAHTACIFSRQDQTDHDVWTCWTAPCTGTVFVRTCGLTGLDTKISVYEGCDCPTAGGADPLSCNDDGCSSQATQSLLSFDAVANQRYLIRVGTFPGTPGGQGAVQIECGLDNCPAAGNTNNCNAGNTGPGCSDQTCCESVCAVDPFCCSDLWDATCASEAAGLCNGNFLTCTSRAGSCSNPQGNGGQGCSDNECCNAVCRQDPFCCITEWDDLCAQREAATCHSVCAASTEDCFTPHATAGCGNDECCSQVCPRDPFCCQSEWDVDCVGLANEHCR